MATKVKGEWQGDWVKKFDANYQLPYWANKKTKASSWSAPPGWVEAKKEEKKASPLPPPLPSKLPSKQLWLTMYDKNKYAYYVELSTQETTWEKPTAGEFTTWHAMTDAASGNRYYLHSVTKETQWDVPKELENVMINGSPPEQVMPSASMSASPRGGPTERKQSWQSQIEEADRKAMVRNTRMKSQIMHSAEGSSGLLPKGSFDYDDDDEEDDDVDSDAADMTPNTDDSKMKHMYTTLSEFSEKLDGMIEYAASFYPLGIRGNFNHIKSNLTDVLKYLASDMDALCLGGRKNVEALVEWERMDWDFKQPEVKQYRDKARSLEYSGDVYKEWHVPQLFLTSKAVPTEMASSAKVACLYDMGQSVDLPVTMKAADAISMCLSRSIGMVGKVEEFVLKAQGFREYMFGDHRLLDYAFVKDRVLNDKPRTLVLMEMPKKTPPCLPPKPTPYIGDQQPAHATLFPELKSRWSLRIVGVHQCNDAAAFPILSDMSFNNIFVSSFLFHGTTIIPHSPIDLKPQRMSGNVLFKENHITEVELASLPRETRHALLVYGVKSGAKTLLGWVSHNIIDCEGVFKRGEMSFKLWGSTKELENLRTLNANKLADAMRNQGNLDETAKQISKNKKMQKELEKQKLADIANFIENDHDYVFRGTNRPNLDPKVKAATITIQIHVDDEKVQSEDQVIWAPRKFDIVEPTKQQRGQSFTQKGLKMAGSEGVFNKLLQMDPLHKITPRDRELLWKTRELLCKYPAMLPRFLESVDWLNPAHRWEAHRVMREWSPVTVPAVLISMLDAKYQDTVVREYAVEQLAKVEEDELQMYLLQLVQCLKNESYHHSALGDMLLRRGMRSPFVIGHYLFWHLKAETVEPAFCERYAVLIEQYLNLCEFSAQELRKQNNVILKLQRVAERVATRKESGKYKKKENKKLFLQELKDMNENFLARMHGGKFQVPLFPTMEVTDLVVEKCNFMSSKMAPLWLCFNNADKTATPGTPAARPLIMFKSGDDLRQDILTLQVLDLMDKLWLKAGIDFKMSTYKVIATGVNSQNRGVGMLEIVTESETTSGIQMEHGGGAGGAWTDSVIADYLKKNNSTAEGYTKAIDNFTRSCAGYCVATSVLGIGDRHNGNIMVKKSGCLFHIDFGHFLGNFKSKFGVKRERVAFVFTPDMAHVIGGGSKNKNDQNYKLFLSLCGKAFSVLREPDNCRQIMGLFQRMVTAGMPELTAEEDILYMKHRMVLEMTDSEAQQFIQSEVNSSKASKWRQLDNWFHNKKHG